LFSADSKINILIESTPIDLGSVVPNFFIVMDPFDVLGESCGPL